MIVIDMYGLTIGCKTENKDLAFQLLRPFKYFTKENGKAEVNITIEEKDPPYHTFPTLKASFSTPRNIVFKDDKNKIIDYFGKGVVIENNNHTAYTIYSCDQNFLQEVLYLLVISLFGQYCDKNKMLRIHALALSYKDTAILLPITPGGGKSTMAMAMLEEEDFKLISDDEPVMDKLGFINPFPIRIGTLDHEKISKIPKQFVYSIDRMEFGHKYFIDIEFWANKLERRPLNKCILFVSQKQLNGKPNVQKCSKIKTLKVLVRDAVIGVGLYQGVEFLFSHSPFEIISRIGIAWQRFYMALKLTLRSQTFEILFSRDISMNTQVFRDFVRSLPNKE